MVRTVERWKRFEEVLQGPKEGNPFQEVRLAAEFSNGCEKVVVTGFYCGNGEYRIRFMPQSEGEWTYVTASNAAELNQKTGSFVCTAAEGKNHGPVRVRSQIRAMAQVENLFGYEDEYRFAYEDGTPYHPFGTTCYAWTHQPEEVQEETVRIFEKGYFNKVRMCLFPKFYTYNHTDPKNYVFPGDRESGFDFTRFDPAYFDQLEKRLDEMDALGMEADLILFHPYDRWGFSHMTREEDHFYLQYVLARLASYKNVWWSLANEYDLMPQKSIEDWETIARVVVNHDPYGHLRSIHNCIKFYDYTKPWITHCSVQRVDVYKTAESITEWRELYHKPVVVDECAYEGSMNYGWGSITGEEMTRRFWEGVVRGGYLTHGESYVEQPDTIWWSHGGLLQGDSPERIQFLQQLIEQAPDELQPLKVTIENHEYNWDMPCAHVGEEYFLYYFGFYQMAFRKYQLPAGKKYRITIVDTWNMTRTELPELYSGEIEIKLPRKQYLAVQMVQVQE